MLRILLCARETCLRNGAPWNILEVTAVRQLYGSHRSRSGMDWNAPVAMSLMELPSRLRCWSISRPWKRSAVISGRTL